jgi:predicted regulator of Ras-like GTPase activity (Roadblock/LC7/MglB family)
MSVEQVLKEVQNELGLDFVAADVVGMDGLSIGGISADDSFDTSAAAARFAMVMKLASRVSDKLSIGTVEDNLITTDSGFMISRFLGDGSYYWVITVTPDSVLGQVRQVMNEYSNQLWKEIPH